MGRDPVVLARWVGHPLSNSQLTGAPHVANAYLKFKSADGAPKMGAHKHGAEIVGDILNHTKIELTVAHFTGISRTTRAPATSAV